MYLKIRKMGQHVLAGKSLGGMQPVGLHVMH